MDTLLQRINELITQIQEKFDSLKGKVDWILGKIPWGLGWLGDKLRDAWNAFVEKWDDFWAKQETFWGNMGDRDSLSTTSAAWVSDVGSPVSGKVDVVDRALLKADDHWTGQAAATYFPKASLHKTAMDKIQSTFVTAATGAIETVRAGLTKFYTGLIVALGALVTGMIGAIASTATIFGAPAGPFIAGGAILVAGAAFYTGGVLLKSDCTTAKQTLFNARGNNTGFPDGEWPTGAILTA